MAKLTYILIFTLAITSCGIGKQNQNRLQFNAAEISKIEVYEGYPGKPIQMQEGFTEAFVKDLNKSRKISPTKYIRPYSFRIFHRNGKIDTILTNGTIHSYDGWRESKENLIQKYAVPSESQLITAKKLRFYMDNKNYDAAIELFSKERQADIRKIQNDNIAHFEYWCAVWTFDEAKFERYAEKIKSGKAAFIYENNAWKIDEK